MDYGNHQKIRQPGSDKAPHGSKEHRRLPIPSAPVFDEEYRSRMEAISAVLELVRPLATAFETQLLEIQWTGSPEHLLSNNAIARQWNLSWGNGYKITEGKVRESLEILLNKIDANKEVAAKIKNIASRL